MFAAAVIRVVAVFAHLIEPVERLPADGAEIPLLPVGPGRGRGLALLPLDPLVDLVLVSPLGGRRGLPCLGPHATAFFPVVNRH